ncbi:hypothetical protein QR680_010671 [Steinernema hermaphroditum]|uniref:Uncharacterized protein n=1 Tax=Steinernema hermaphroditum TaxID=289476 RepID=A0AA39IR94_9BILA|nr:hypothetical protein QR680_010671 [Steinernema hermaphroditum]
MKSLFDVTATAMIRLDESPDLATLPSAARISFNRNRSLHIFKKLYYSFFPSPQSCIEFNGDGSIDIDRTLSNAQDHLKPDSIFRLYVATGRIEKLQEIWDLCHGSCQDDLLHSSITVCKFFAELCEYGETRSGFNTMELCVECLSCHYYDLAVYFFKASNLAQKQNLLLVQQRVVLKEVPRTSLEYELDCQGLRRLLEVKDFEIGECLVEGYVHLECNLFEQFFDLPLECQDPEFRKHLMKP